MSLIDSDNPFVQRRGDAVIAAEVRPGPGNDKRGYAQAVVPCRIDGEGLDARAVPATAPLAVAAVIANAASLSGAVRIDGRLVGVILPAAWTTAALSFQGSVDGETFFDVYDAATERTIAEAAVVANRFLALDPDAWRAFTHIKVRSGVAGTAVAQGAQRVLTLVKG